MIQLKGKSRGLVVVSNRLPFSRCLDDSGEVVWKKGAGGLITALEPILNREKGIWLGWDGMPSNEPDAERSGLFDVSDIIPQERGPKTPSYRIGCVPLSEEEVEKYYNNFSNGTLWALFHYFFEKSVIDYPAWRVYDEVNRRFADHICGVAGPDDIVWIQDFHLFMAPYYLRKARPGQEIHFFLHIPFPHIDIFSILPWQRQILESLLSCNTVGFHHRQYYRNFVEAVKSYSRSCPGLSLEHIRKERGARFYANPISIDFEKLDRTSRERHVQKKKKELRRHAGCPKLILGVDRIDYSKGIKERMLGLEKLLADHPELCEKFFYYQLVIPSREHVEVYQNLKREIDEIIGRINGRFSTGMWTPVHYNYGTLPFDDLVALYLAADVALVTPLRDGMNLVCKEYIAAHSDDDGVLVLSKFAGAIAEIKNCLPVNPYSIEDIENAIYQALAMPEKERKKRMAKMRSNIRAHSIDTWLDNCVRQFEGAEGGMLAPGG